MSAAAFDPYSRPTRSNGQPSARFPNESGAAGEGRVVAGDPYRPPGGASISRTALSPPCLVAANTI